MKTQNQKILSHLKRAKINPLQALELYGCFRLASRINDLRNDGHNIQTEIVNKNGKHYATYKLWKAK